MEISSKIYVSTPLKIIIPIAHHPLNTPSPTPPTNLPPLPTTSLTSTPLTPNHPPAIASKRLWVHSISNVLFNVDIEAKMGSVPINKTPFASSLTRSVSRPCPSQISNPSPQHNVTLNSTR